MSPRVKTESNSYKKLFQGQIKTPNAEMRQKYSTIPKEEIKIIQIATKKNVADVKIDVKQL